MGVRERAGRGCLSWGSRNPQLSPQSPPVGGELATCSPQTQRLLFHPARLRPWSCWWRRLCAVPQGPWDAMRGVLECLASGTLLAGQSPSAGEPRTLGTWQRQGPSEVQDPLTNTQEQRPTQMGGGTQTPHPLPPGERTSPVAGGTHSPQGGQGPARWGSKGPAPTVS